MDHVQAGRDAHAQGLPRLLPKSYMVDFSINMSEAAAWYHGWDKANLEANKDLFKVTAEDIAALREIAAQK